MQFSLVTDDTPTSSNANSGGNTNVDWDKVNAEKREREEKIVALLETQNSAETLRGVVVGYVDLGIQERGEYEDIYEPENPDHIKKLENGSFVEDRYNSKEKKKVPTLCTPATPAKAYTLVVDFPDYMVDYGGQIGEKPFRMYMGGNFFVKNPANPDKKMQIIQRPFYMVENTNNPQGKWALGTTSIPAKMGVHAGIDTEGLVTKNDIVKLIGKTFQFEVRVWFKPAKDDPSKTYYTENIKYVGKLPKGMEACPVKEEDCFVVNMSAANKPEWIKQVRAIAKNTMTLAQNWEGSKLKEELEALRNNSGASSTQGNTQGSNEENSGTEGGSGTSSVDKKRDPQPTVTPDLDDGWDDDKL